MRTFKYIFIGIITSVIILITAAYAIFNSQPFQNWLTHKLSDYLSAQFKTKISIGSVRYKPLQTFELEKVLFGDHKNDTLFYAGKLAFHLGGMHLDSTIFSLNDVRLEGGYCNLVYYPDGSFNIDVLDNINDPNDTLPSDGPPFVLKFNRVKLVDTRFRFVDYTDSSEWDGFAPNDEYFYDISGYVSDFNIIDDSLIFSVDHLQLKEKSGFQALHMEANAIISSTCMLFDSLKVKTPYSYVGNYFGMKYQSWESFGDFYNKVRMEASLIPSDVDMTDIHFFAPQLKEFKYKVKAKGRCKGSLANLNLKDLDIRFGRTGVFKGDASFNGLPDFENTFIDAEVTTLQASKADIEYLYGNSLDAFPITLGLMSFNGRYTGFYTDFVAYGNLKTAIGDIATDVNMKLADDADNYIYSGNIAASQFDLGKLLNLSYLGQLNTTAYFNGKGFDFNTMTIEAKLDETNFALNGYNYRKINTTSTISNKTITTNLLIEDPNLEGTLVGEFNFSQEIPRYNLKAAIEKANIKSLGFDTMDLTIKTNADIKFGYKDIDHNDGTIKLTSTELFYEQDEYLINNISLQSINREGFRSLNLKTDFIEAELNGKYNFVDIEPAVKQYLSHYIPAYISGDSNRQNLSQQSFLFQAKIKSLYPFNDLFFRDYSLQDLVLDAEFIPQNQHLVFNAKAKELSVGKIQLNGLTIHEFNPLNKGIQLIGELKRLYYQDTLLTKDVTLKADIAKNQAYTHLNVNDSSSLFVTDIHNVFTFYGDSITCAFLNSSLNYRKSIINFDEDNELVYLKSGLRFNHFVMSGNYFNRIKVEGLLGWKNNHELKVDLDNVKLNLVNELVPSYEIETNGLLDGSMSLKTKNNDWYLTSDASLLDVSFDKDTLGDFKLMSNYLDKEQRLMTLLRSVKGKLKNLELGGFYDFKNKSDALNYTLNFDESDITSFQAFLKDYVRLYTGSVSATGQITGSLQYPEVNCDIDMMGVTLMVEYLKTMYSFSTNVNINEQVIKLKPTEIRDIYDRRAMLAGQIKHKNFSQLQFNLKLNNLNNFQLLNTGSKDNDLFYGTAYADGNLSLTGPVNDLMIEGKFMTRRGTNISIPISTGISETEDGLLHFVSRDSVMVTNNRKRSGSISGFTISCMLQVNKDADIQIVFDEAAGDKIRGKGTGDIKLELSRSGQFSMYGEVEIEEGDYKFSAMNLFTKKFLLKKGGSIKWTGDPLAGTMNITGVYNVRTTLADIVSVATNEERESLKQQRIPVECLLYLKGNLLSPDIKFDLNVNDINGNLSGNASSELQNILRLWRNENELMTQQVVSLMLFGRFSPTNVQNSTGPTSLTAGVNNTLSGFVSAQATSLIQKIIPGFNVNVDYQTATESSRQRAIISASRNFFDNRLEIQANYDPINTYQNFLTQYNLTREGNLKAKAFSRAQLDPIYNRNINTQGVGFYYRKEFDRLGDIFKPKVKKVNNLK